MKKFIVSLAFLFVALLFINGCGCAIFSPWPNASTVIRDTEATEIKVGKEFVIRYDIIHNMFPIIKETYDENYLTLLERKFETSSDPADSTYWFLFKTNKTGDTSITITEFTHQSDAIQSEKTFEIHVVQP